MSLIINPYAFGTIASAVTWNPADKSSRVTLSGGNLTARKTAGTTSTWDMARATQGLSSGKRYFEVLCVRISGTDSNIMVGIAKSTAPLDTASGFPGGDANGYGMYLLNGNKFNAGSSSAYSTAWDGNTTIGVAVDFTAGKVWLANENTYGGGGNPSAGTGEAFSGLSGTFFPAASMLNGNVFDCTGRFTLASFTYAPPSGFSAWES
jgi:hypothetical protein